eukprot:GHVL01022181.1.p1 GENE.GHVL01022181.1~~GHVL01022181.1.p1  ORF type:complete len:460 (+),score=89.71 GHVL01022181.1:226-1605(+)
MSRAGAAKGGKEKTKPPVSQTPVTATEIVPGKFNESDWNIMIDRDNSEEFIFDIVDEVVNGTMDSIYKMYIETQVLPFTLQEAKDAILQIIEWQFLTRDEGEEDVIEGGWIEDEEPNAAVTDCWAQGSVPKTEVPMPSPIPEEPEEEEKATEQEEAEAEIEVSVAELEDKVSEGEEPEEAELMAAESAAAETEAKRKEEEEAKKKRKKFKPYRGKMKSAGVSKMTESLEEREMQMYMKEFESTMPPQEISSNILAMPASCHSILKVQNGRPPGTKDVQYDQMGNVMAVMCLDPERLPTHRVSVKYQVVDPAVEAAQARLEAMRRGRFIAPSQKQAGKGAKPKRHAPSETNLLGKSMKTRKPTITPLPPSLIESMDVAPGVSVTEAGRTKKGPGRYVRKADLLEQHQKDLQPVTIKIRSNTISVSDLLDRNTPILRPIDETVPLPPIIPTPPASHTHLLT